jgi:hypothetical protein
MSSMTLTQMAEKPITVATEAAISNFADSRQRRRFTIFCRRKNIVRSRSLLMHLDWLRLP